MASSLETVCLSHITDDVLRGVLGEVADKLECSFCTRKPGRSEKPFAVEMDELGSRLWDGGSTIVMQRAYRPLCVIETGFRAREVTALRDVVDYARLARSPGTCVRAADCFSASACASHVLVRLGDRFLELAHALLDPKARDD